MADNTTSTLQNETRPLQTQLVRRILDEFNDGKTFAGIARDLAAEGYTTRSGATWQHPQVKHIICNGVYAGLRQ